MQLDNKCTNNTFTLKPCIFTASHGEGVYIENGAGSAGASVSQTGVAASASAGAGGDGSPALNFGSNAGGEASIAGSAASASSGGYAGAGASAGYGSGNGFKHGGRPDYDKVFNVSLRASFVSRVFS